MPHSSYRTDNLLDQIRGAYLTLASKSGAEDPSNPNPQYLRTSFRVIGNLSSLTIVVETSPARQNLSSSDYFEINLSREMSSSSPEVLGQCQKVYICIRSSEVLAFIIIDFVSPTSLTLRRRLNQLILLRIRIDSVSNNSDAFETFPLIFFIANDAALEFVRKQFVPRHPKVARYRVITFIIQ